MNEWNRSNIACLVAIKGIIMMVSSDSYNNFESGVSS